MVWGLTKSFLLAFRWELVLMPEMEFFVDDIENWAW